MTVALPAAKSATDAAGDLFLSGHYLELGIAAWGNFGTTQGQTPAGYAQVGNHGVGLTFNAAGFGVNPAIPTIDFFTPGTPWESFAAGYTIAGTNTIGNNYQDGGDEGVTATSLTDTSSGSTLSAEWIGVLDGDLRVTIDTSFGVADEYFTTKVTLTNLSGSAMSDVRYDRDVDPDNTVYAGGNYATINTIVGQEPGAASEVTAVSASGDPYDVATGTTTTLAYYSTDPGVRVADGFDFGGGLDPFDPAFTTGAGVAGSTTGLSDTAINLNYDGGALAAGASTSFSYVTAVTDDIASTLAAAVAAATPTPTPTPVVAAVVATPPPAPTLALQPGSDSGLAGDDVTNVTTPTVGGTAQAGSTVTVLDDEGGTLVAVASAVADSTGAWSATLTQALPQGTVSLLATATNGAGVSALSAVLGLTIASVAPAVTAAFVANPLDAASDGIVYSPILVGGGDPNATVTLRANGIVVGTAQASATGAWSFDPTGLAAGGSTLVASETDVAGNTGTSAATPATAPITRFTVANVNAQTSGTATGSAYTGPVSTLQSEFAYVGPDNVIIGATVANVFLVSGAGDDALQATAGSNVLDGGTGSNWLVGATGADGGHDTFFVDGRDGKMTWDTLLNFHVGDMLTVWGYNSASGHFAWTDDQGAPGYKGATLQASLGAGSPSAFVTFDGLARGTAHFSTSTGQVGGVDYLMVSRIA